jgi:hypothetical protein
MAGLVSDAGLVVPYGESGGGGAVSSVNGQTGAVSLGFKDLNDTPSSYVGNAGKVPVVNPTENGLVYEVPFSGAIVGTYAEIKALKDSSSLIPLQEYIITDYQTVHVVLNDNVPRTLNTTARADVPVERIKLTASTVDTFLDKAESVDFQGETGSYDIDNNKVAEEISGENNAGIPTGALVIDRPNVFDYEIQVADYAGAIDIFIYDGLGISYNTQTPNGQGTYYTLTDMGTYQRLEFSGDIPVFGQTYWENGVQGKDYPQLPDITVNSATTIRFTGAYVSIQTINIADSIQSYSYTEADLGTKYTITDFGGGDYEIAFIADPIDLTDPIYNNASLGITVVATLDSPTTNLVITLFETIAPRNGYLTNRYNSIYNIFDANDYRGCVYLRCRPDPALITVYNPVDDYNQGQMVNYSDSLFLCMKPYPFGILPSTNASIWANAITEFSTSQEGMFISNATAELTLLNVALTPLTASKAYYFAFTNPQTNTFIEPSSSFRDIKNASDLHQNVIYSITCKDVSFAGQGNTIAEFCAVDGLKTDGSYDVFIGTQRNVSLSGSGGSVIRGAINFSTRNQFQQSLISYQVINTIINYASGLIAGNITDSTFNGNLQNTAIYRAISCDSGANFTTNYIYEIKSVNSPADVQFNNNLIFGSMQVIELTGNFSGNGLGMKEDFVGTVTTGSFNSVIDSSLNITSDLTGKILVFTRQASYAQIGKRYLITGNSATQIQVQSYPGGDDFTTTVGDEFSVRTPSTNTCLTGGVDPLISMVNISANVMLRTSGELTACTFRNPVRNKFYNVSSTTSMGSFTDNDCRNMNALYFSGSANRNSFDGFQASSIANNFNGNKVIGGGNVIGTDCQLNTLMLNNSVTGNSFQYNECTFPISGVDFTSATIVKEAITKRILRGQGSIDKIEYIDATGNYVLADLTD